MDIDRPQSRHNQLVGMAMDTPEMPQNQINDLELLDGVFRCLNEECDVQVMENYVKVEGHIQCKKCLKIYCDKCNGVAHAGLRCSYKCPKCKAINPVANLMLLRYMKSAEKSSKRGCCADPS